MNRPTPSVGAPRRLQHIPVAMHELANGLTVAVVERHAVPIVSLEIVTLPGAVLDLPVLAGRTAMTAEMLDEGTATRGALDIAEQIDYLGADLSIQPGWDATAISLHVLARWLEPALDIVSDLVIHAAFPVNEFERKQKERLAALLLERDEPDVLAAKAMLAGVFGSGHPYTAPLGGTRASIDRLTREDVHDLYRTQFHAANSFVIVVGDVSTSQIVAALDARLGSWRTAATTRPALPPVSEPDTRRILLIDKPGAAQAELRVGHVAPERAAPDYFAIRVLNTILGGSFTSRLNTILRERMGVTYGASSRFRMRRVAGVFSAGAAIATEAVARSAQVIIEEMTRLQNDLVHVKELNRAQNYIAFGLPRFFESTADIAAHLREQLVYDLPLDYWETYVDRILAVSSDDVRSTAQRRLQPDTSMIAVVANAASVRDSLSATGLGEVVLTDVAA